MTKIQNIKMMVSQKVPKSIYCHSGESRARSEALALSSHFKLLDSGFRRSDRIATFYETVKNSFLSFFSVIICF
jgi:hypothetical protein